MTGTVWFFSSCLLQNFPLSSFKKKKKKRLSETDQYINLSKQIQTWFNIPRQVVHTSNVIFSRQLLLVQNTEQFTLQHFYPKQSSPLHFFILPTPRPPSRQLPQTHFYHKFNYFFVIFISMLNQLKRAAEWSANGHKVEQAIQLYDDSAALYAKINQPIQKTQITLRIAEVRVIEENYLKAVRRYEEAAKRYLKSERYTLGAKNVVVNIVLCHLANGKIKKAKGTINRYKGLDKTFKGSKQCLFLTAIVKAYSSDDIVAFDEQCEWMMDVITMDTQRNKLYEEIRQQLATTDEEKRRAKKRADQAERQRLALEEEQPPPPPVEIPEGINQAIQRLEMGG
eukprot:TRINITY_DN3072_c0_g2_i1.p1 TRINITY_DN3072_c0_g2~~TRINITY_DN3072_c0_g2_i1.p1  ORF type:complete len:354 (+),score=49.81 TRINITY_DN3072_c0_g2_i1:47-1063(+)